MLFSSLVTLCVLQSIEPVPDAKESGESIEVRALAVDGSRVEGIEIFVSPNRPGSEEDGVVSASRQSLGRTGADGRLEVRVPEPSGRYRLEARIEGVRCLAPIHAIEPQTRWPLGVLGALVAGVVFWLLFGRSRGR